MAKQPTFNEKTDRLWKECFKSSSLWYNNFAIKGSSGSSKLLLRSSNMPLGVVGCYNPPWVQEEMNRREVTHLVMEDEKCYKRNRDEKELFASLKTHAEKRDICKGVALHADILERGLLEKNVHLATSLINMYAKCGALENAWQVLEELPIRNVFCWSALITGYAQQGKSFEAINCFEVMQFEGVYPDAITFSSILKACSFAGYIDKGIQIHEDIVSRGWLEKDVVIGNALVDMYAKCGFLDKAQEVLKELPIRDKISWSALISGYVEQGKGYKALECFEQMQCEGLPPDRVCFVCISKACGIIGSMNKGKKIHEQILSGGVLGKDIMLGTALVDMYAKCDDLTKAKEVLEGFPTRNVVIWNALITGYVLKGQNCKAFDCMESMRTEGLSPNSVTFICILKACGNTGNIVKGQLIHDEITNREPFMKDIDVGNALVDMYAKCGSLLKAQEVLEGLHTRDTISWSTMISAYAVQGQNHEALNSFNLMLSEGLSPDVVTFISILRVCGSITAIEQGKMIHEEILNRCMLVKDITVGISLVDMYAKCGDLVKAQKVLEELPEKNAVAWNTLIIECSQQGKCHEVLSYFEAMRSEGLSPDVITYTCILKACGSIGAIDTGKNIHEEVLSKGMLRNDGILGTALVDMYAKCGFLARAQDVLEEITDRDVVCWNVLIAGYALRGKGCEALISFNQMQSEGIFPDEATFLCVLNACSHSGKLKDAETLYRNMAVKYGIAPSIEHHICMVVVFCYAGHFNKAISVIKMMPCSDYVTVWLALLGACRKWGNTGIGKLAFDHIVHLDDGSPAAYVLTASILEAAIMEE